LPFHLVPSSDLKRFLLLFLVAALGAAGCRSTDAAVAPRRDLVLLTGPSTGAYVSLGAALAEVYNKRLTDARVTATPSEGPRGAGATAATLAAGKADLALSRSDLAYQVYRGGASGSDEAGTHLRSIAVVYANAVHVVVRRGSGIARGAEFRNHRVQVSGDEPQGGALARAVLDGYGIELSDVQIVPDARNAVARLKAGELDVRIFASAYPLAGIDDVGEESALRLMSIEPEVIDRMRSRFPFFKPAIIPKGTYKGQHEDVQTVGIDGLHLCRDEMPESLVYELTKSLFEALPDLAKTQRIARLIDIGRAPATPVPLHPGAARYYRERDLFR
jgi:TRAP transporter TAXI family solute receptor